MDVRRADTSALAVPADLSGNTRKHTASLRCHAQRCVWHLSYFQACPALQLCGERGHPSSN